MSNNFMIKNPLYEKSDPLSFFLGDTDADTRSEARGKTGQQIPPALKKDIGGVLADYWLHRA
jgi:hypothetical protein